MTLRFYSVVYLQHGYYCKHSDVTVNPRIVKIKRVIYASGCVRIWQLWLVYCQLSRYYFMLLLLWTICKTLSIASTWALRKTKQSQKRLNACLNKNIFESWLKIDLKCLNICPKLMWWGSWFQATGPAYENARSPCFVTFFVIQSLFRSKFYSSCGSAAVCMQCCSPACIIWQEQISDCR